MKNRKEAIQDALAVYRKPTMTDNLIGFFSPSSKEKRLKSRFVQTFLASYSGADKQRRSMAGWSTSTEDADSAIRWDLQQLRDRSSDLIRNNPLAAGIIQTKVGNIVGGGLKMKATVDGEYLGMSDEAAQDWNRKTEREFHKWANSHDVDCTRTNNFYQLQELIFTSVLERGDAFAMFVRGNHEIYQTALQLIEADRCSNPNYAADTTNMIMGVKKGAKGNPVSYFFRSRHPGSLTYNGKGDEWTEHNVFTREGKRRILHLYRKRRIGQTRGVPDIAPIIEPLRQLGDYTDAELTAAVVSGLFTAFIKSESGDGFAPMQPTGEIGGKTSDDDFKMAAGAIVQLAQGEDVSFANPGRPSTAFDPFVMSILQQIGVAIELPFELVIQKFQSSYSASKAAMEQAWLFFKNRRKWLDTEFCQPVYERWLDEAVALGVISAPGYFTDPGVRAAYQCANWHGAAKPIMDLTKEVKGRALMESRGWITAAQNTVEMTGGDWESNHRQRKKELEMMLEQPMRVTSEGGDVEADTGSGDDISEDNVNGEDEDLL